MNRQAAVNLVKVLPGSRIMLRPDEYTLKFVGQSAVWFTTECGIVDAVPFLEGCARRRQGADDSSPSCK